MNWSVAAARVVAVIVLAGLVGWFYGAPLLAMLVALLAGIAFSVYQMRQVERWLNDPQQVPPDVYGIWGELVARIHLHQRKNNEIQERLQSTVEYLQNSLSSMRDGVVMVDAQGAIKWLNEAVEPLLGLRFPQDTGQTLTNLVREPQFNTYFLQADYGTPLQYCSGGDRKTHLRVEITYFGEGERLLFVRDVSAAVRMEQMRRDFVANVSHELRTPLTVITGYLGTFAANPAALPEHYLKPVQQMSQQAERMENLLKDLLWLSRIESDEREDKRELLDVAGLLQELRDELTEMQPQWPIELDISTDCKVYGDYRELYSAVSNLAGNAIKYSPQGSPVRINWSKQGGNCVLRVQDSGIGIDDIHLPRLTERFYRVDDSRSSATGGTGLGLAIVKHVAAAHGAQLQIESELGQGSSFALLFPEGETAC